MKMIRMKQREHTAEKSLFSHIDHVRDARPFIEPQTHTHTHLEQHKHVTVGNDGVLCEKGNDTSSKMKSIERKSPSSQRTKPRETGNERELNEATKW